LSKNKVIYILCLVIAITLSGCKTTQKPLDTDPPSSPKTLVPEVSTVAFDSIDIRNTPTPVQDVAKDMSGKEMAVWLKVNNTAYVLVNQSKNTSANRVEISEILRKIPIENYIWYQVTLNYKSANGQETAFINEPLAAKFTLPADYTISGVGFDFEKIKNIQTKPIAQEPLSPHTSEENRNTVSGPVTLEISNPLPDAEVTAPFRITGRLKNVTTQNKEQLIVRLRDDAGKVIVEKPVSSDQYRTGNNFEETLSYPALTTPEKGSVEALLFDRETGAEKNVVKIPVTLK
jgi:hypothetical protein